MYTCGKVKRSSDTVGCTRSNPECEFANCTRTGSSTQIHTQIRPYKCILALGFSYGGEEREKTRVDNNEREKGGKRERDEERKQKAQ